MESQRQIWLSERPRGWQLDNFPNRRRLKPEFGNLRLIPTDCILVLAAGSVAGRSFPVTGMVMNRSHTFRLGVAVLSIALGCYALMARWPSPEIFFCLYPMLVMSPANMCRTVPNRKLLILTCPALAFVFLLAACRCLIPAPTASAIERVVRHPAFVLPYGLLLLWGIYRSYRIQTRQVATTNSQESQPRVPPPLETV